MDRLEFKSAFAVDDEGTITGTAWGTGPDRDGDIIAKGGFADMTLPLPILAFHDHNDPVGAWTEAVETDAGLIVKGKLLVNEVARAREIAALARAGAVRGLSIGFRARSATPRPGARGRIIKSVELVEISLVTVPCHPGARVRSVKTGLDAIRIADAINRAALALRSR